VREKGNSGSERKRGGSFGSAAIRQYRGTKSVINKREGVVMKKGALEDGSPGKKSPLERVKGRLFRLQIKF